MNDPVRLSLFWAAVLACTPLNAQNLDAVDHVTVPMSVEGNAPIVTLTFKKPDGSSRRARFVFDSGGGGIILNEGLAKDLGEKPIGPVMSSDGQRFQEVDVPAAWVGRMPIDLRGSRTFMHLGATSFTNRDTVEGLLPGKAFEHYQVVLDYPRQEWSVGEPGTLQHRGERIAAPYITSSGHPRIEVVVGEQTFGMLLDTGTQLTLFRDDLLQRWSRENPVWPRSRGPVGPANVAGVAVDALLLRIPVLRIGSVNIARVAAVSRPDKTYSATKFETPAAIVGALGGNVLSQFRVEIDYPDQLLFLERSNKIQENDFQTVGLVLDTDAVGDLVVRAVSPSASSITRQNILPGDVILKIGSLSEAPYTLTMAGHALSGAVGERKQLYILRNGNPLIVEATVSRIL